jgi:small subunit ribosomal protein S16
MAVRIRLRRIGRKKQPYYRVVVMPSTAPRDGAYLDEVGFYNPRTRPAFLTMDLAKVDAWLEKGAEVTDSAASLIRKARKGGDAAVRFVQPGEEVPAMKTAPRPERRPSGRPAATEEKAPTVEPATDPLEAAAPDAEKEPPAESMGGDTQEAVAAEAEAEAAPTAQEPKAEEPKAEEPAAEEPKADEPAAEEPAAEPAADEPAAEPAAAQPEAAADEATRAEAAAPEGEQATAEEPAEEQQGEAQGASDEESAKKGD